MLLEMLELKVPFSNLKPQEIVRALMNGSPLPQVERPPSFACAPSLTTPCHWSMSFMTLASLFKGFEVPTRIRLRGTVRYISAWGAQVHQCWKA